MRARNIKPDFFKNEELSELDFMTRLLFVGLWCYADRDGCFELRPKRIKAEIFPYDNISDDAITKALAHLVASAFIQGYNNSNGHDMMKILNFKKHQRPHYNEKPSILNDIIETCTLGSKHLLPNVQALRPDIMNEDLMNEDLMNDNRGMMNEDITHLLFEKFWEAYPKKKSQPAALKAFAKAQKKFNDDDSFLSKILKSIELNKKSESWQENQFIPYPATWLNQEQFNDEVFIFKKAKTKHDENMAVAEKMIKQAQAEETDIEQRKNLPSARDVVGSFSG